MAGEMNAGSIGVDFTLRTEDAERRLDQIRMRVAGLRTDFAEGSMSVDAYEAEMRSLAQEADRLQRSLANAGNAAGRIDLAPPSRGMRNFGMAALETSRAVEDAQYGIAGVVNNIPSLVMAVGGAAGVTAVVSLAAVAVAQLVKHWDELTGTMQDVGPIEKARQKLEELEGQARRTAEQEAELARLRRQTSLADELATDQGKAGREFSSTARRALLDDKEVRDAAIRAEFDRANPNGITATDAEREQARRSATSAIVGGGPGGGGAYLDEKAYEEELARLVEQRRINEEEAARLRVAEAAESKEQAAELVALLRDAGRGDLADRFQAALDEPARQEAEKAAKERKAESDAARRESEAIEQENRANAERYFAEEQDRAKQLASGMQGRYDLAALGGGGFDVAGQLAGAGVADVGRMAPLVAEQLARTLDEAVRQRALGSEGGEAEARADMLQEARARARDEAVRAAEATDPALRKRAERFATTSMLGGGLDPVRFEREVADSLRRQGLGDQEAGLAAEQIAAKAGLDAAEFVTGLRGEQEQKRGVDQFGADRLLERVQAGVGDRDVGKQQLAVLEKVEAHLRQIAEDEIQAHVTRAT